MDHAGAKPMVRGRSPLAAPVAPKTIAAPARTIEVFLKDRQHVGEAPEASTLALRGARARSPWQDRAASPKLQTMSAMARPPRSFRVRVSLSEWPIANDRQAQRSCRAHRPG